MNSRSGWQAIGITVLGLALSACAGIPGHEPVHVNVVGIDALPGEALEMRMAVRLRVQNPNETIIDFDGVSIALDVRGTPFATGVSDQRGSVPRFGETVITVPVSVSAFAAVSQALGLAGSERPRLDYALHGRLSGAGFGGMRFESSGQIDLPAVVMSK